MVLPAEFAAAQSKLIGDLLGKPQPVGITQKSADALRDFAPGQRFTATIQALLSDGTYRAAVAGRSLTLALPFAAKAGDSLELETVERNGKTTLAVVAKGGEAAGKEATKTDANASVTTRLTPTGKLIAELLTGIDKEGGKRPQPVPLNNAQPVFGRLPAQTAEIAAGLRAALGKSGMFYESHQARWVQGQTTLTSLLSEPQGKLSPAAHAHLMRASGEPMGAARPGAAPLPQNPAAQNPAQTGTQATGTQPAGAQPAGTPPAGTQPAGTQPAGAQPAGAQSAGTQPAGTQPPGTQPAGTQPTGTQPAGAQPAGTQPTGTPPAGTPPAGAQPAGTQPAGTQPAGAQPTGTLPTGTLPAGTQPAGMQAFGTQIPGGAQIPGAQMPGAQVAGAQTAMAQATGQPVGAQPAGTQAAMAQATGAQTAGMQAGAQTAATPASQAYAQAYAQISAQNPSSASASASPPSTTGALPDSGAVRVGMGHAIAPDLAPMVRQQLEALATNTYVWQGQIWPGQTMEWEIVEEDSSQRQREENTAANWTTHLNLKLPQLGALDATLRLTGGRNIRISLRTENDEARARLIAANADLRRRFEASGLTLEFLDVLRHVRRR
ncbi:MAG: flagellar hook-length control protein FliK [Zoogloeaceae bacterium]|jgi:hypothetical protein|nr:flagellar hook-length control protein FliK [Zoogloeaceae bacterium]